MFFKGFFYLYIIEILQYEVENVHKMFKRVNNDFVKFLSQIKSWQFTFFKPNESVV